MRTLCGLRFLYRPRGVCGSCGCAAFKAAIQIAHETVVFLRIAMITVASRDEVHGMAWFGIWQKGDSVWVVQEAPVNR